METYYVDPTGSLQEVFNHAASDPGSIVLFEPGIYNIYQQLMVPPLQDCQIDAEPAVFNWLGPQDQSLLVLDSCMNCTLEFGKLVYGGQDKALHIHPASPLPIDRSVGPVFTENRVRFQTVANDSPFAPKSNSAVGVFWDGRMGPIVYNEFDFMSILNFCQQCRLDGQVLHNELKLRHVHSNFSSSFALMAYQNVQKNFGRIVWGSDMGALVLGPIWSTQNPEMVEVRR